MDEREPDRASRLERTLESEVVYLCNLFAAVRTGRISPTGLQTNCSAAKMTKNAFSLLFWSKNGSSGEVSVPILSKFQGMYHTIKETLVLQHTHS